MKKKKKSTVSQKEKTVMVAKDVAALFLQSFFSSFPPYPPHPPPVGWGCTLSEQRRALRPCRAEARFDLGAFVTLWDEG